MLGRGVLKLIFWIVLTPVAAVLLGLGFLAASGAGVAHIWLAVFAVVFVFSVVMGFQPFRFGRPRQVME